jgi:uncharacterized protein (UPF0332 family)
VTAQDALARHRLTRARDALGEADLLASAHRWNGALNRLYYAAFYAARASLALKRLDSSRHSGVITLFQEHFVKAGAISSAVARALPQAFSKRQRSDYGDFADSDAAEVQALRDHVERFIRACEEVVGRGAPS